ncbi:MAG: phosphoribosylaminoimidazolesuccinocarboxamide synthase [Acidobacteria bacterium]|nr:phosphoribosylaminoimidazolesuccinocarboxamide synthase [Acidobacteriota bacterium]MYD71904.1 phosphoribosylaminoimidazolesuccinocarboxamide synthase [Acidobacteriota bacterium]MYJ04900.1 phosphoribosylaminoimidazolesuccinocarboxamide synthase [Acidobacteriota bacterium]
MSSTPAPSVESLYETELPGVSPHRRGKVRDMFEVGDDHLLMVATDRISAYDVVLGSVIPDKGRVLTQLSAFWFARTSDLVPNHLVAMNTAAFPAVLQPFADLLAGRSMLVRRTRPLPIECVARGYLSGSGWKEYQRNGRVCGVELPAGLRESDRLPEAIFTPATKAETGHDINITEAEAGEIVGAELVARLRDLTLALYRHGAEHAESCGIIVADTKFEFGLVDDPDGGEAIVLIDEALTPDSSRFWPASDYAPGGGQPSFDKQYVRDYLDRIEWDRQPPAPELPDDVVANTRAKYVEAHRRLTGQGLAHASGGDSGA